MSAVKLLVEPGVTVSRDDFIQCAAPRSVAIRCGGLQNMLSASHSSESYALCAQLKTLRRVGLYDKRVFGRISDVWRLAASAVVETLTR